MEKLILNLKNCNNSKIFLQVQQEILFYTIAKSLWQKIFLLAYTNCNGCLYPHTLKHTCVFLWNQIYMKENKLVERFTDTFYDISFSQLNWNDISLELSPNIDKRMFKERYWQTRKRKEYLRKHAAEYITAIALEDDNNLICQKLKEIFCDKLETEK